MRRSEKNHSALARFKRAKARRLAPSLFSIVVLTVLAAIGLGLTLLSDKVSRANAALQQQQALPGQRGDNSQDISESAARQIQALIDEKERRTPAQQKIDSQLLYTIKMRRGETIAQGVQSLETDVAYDDDGRTVVDIRARVTNALLRRLRAQGATILHSDARYESIRALVRLDRIERIAAFREVVFIQSKQEAITNSTLQDRQPPQIQDDLPPGFKERAERVRGFVSDTLASMRPRGDFSPQAVGSQASQGDLTHKAKMARDTFGANGVGIKIGVLSDGVTNLASSQTLGDLGLVTILPGQAGSGDEGTAMLEIIHDIAPGAKLFFATAFTNITSFAQNIRDLRTAGCDIIVDDVFYFVESPFQDGAPGPTNTNGGAVIEAVNDVVADGAMYFSSAGNSGNKNDNRSGVWEGDFVDGGASAAPLPLTGNVHNFGGQNFNVILANGSLINLHWSDPLGASSNDYDLFILNSTGTAVLASSTNIQNGTQDPYEQTGTGVNLRIVVLKKTGAAARFLHVNSNRGRLSINTDGQTHGHAGATGAFGCAATPASNFAAPPNPVGPFPNPFNSGNTVELFSSDGPRRIFYNANGTPFTPGDVSSTGGMVLQKPDITAADGVSVTGVGGFPSPFFGTSASAPHAAAIAALIKSAGPFTNAQIKTALLSTAIDIEAPGTDRDSGAGIIMAFEAINSLGVAPMANLELGTVMAMENPGDANGVIDAGEGAKLTIPLINTGAVNATNISAMLTTSTPGVTVTMPGTSAYPDLAASGGTANNLTPFTFTLASSVDCPLRITFTLTVTYSGGPGPQMYDFFVQTGQPPIMITSTLDATPPASGAGFTATTGLQTGRVTRVNPPGACGVTKAFPGVTDGANMRQFDAYTFTPCPSGTSHCVTITLTNGCTGNRQLFDAAYLGSFNPASIGTNYLTDAAASNIVGGPITFSATIPAGATFVLVVADVNIGANTAVGCSYTLKVSGACFVCPAVINQLPVAQCQNVTVAAGPGCTADASIDNGSSDPEGGPLTITQTPAGPYPVGVTSVLLTVTDDKGATSQCTANVTVTDSTPPSIICLSSVIGVAAVSCPVAANAVVTYATPTSSDNCGAAPVVCTPPSGSAFPAGTTTVTCTATDGAGNTATCSFNVQAFNICLQDDSNSNTRLLIDTVTGKYQFTCGGAIFSGTGTITQVGCSFTLNHTGGGIRVRANFNTATKSGTASLQQPLGTTKCTITDRNMANNNCNGAP